MQFTALMHMLGSVRPEILFSVQPEHYLDNFSEAFSLQSGTLLLTNAMSDCLNHPDPIGQWTKGYGVFKYE